MPSGIRYRRSFRGQSTEPTHNPMFTRRSWQAAAIQHFSLIGWIVLIGILLLAYWLFYSPAFQITSVQIVGASPSLALDIQAGPVHNQLAATRLFIFPQYSLMLCDTQALAKTIQQTYSLDAVSIDKDFAHRLIITIDEKDPELIWYTQDHYYYLDQQGSVAGMIDDITKAPDTFPQIIDEANEPVTTGQTILDTDRIAFLTSLNAWIRDDGRINIFNYSLPTRQGTQLSLHVSDVPYVVYFDISRDLQLQQDKLKRVLDENMISEKNPTEYIDVRIGDRVYFK